MTKADEHTKLIWDVQGHWQGSGEVVGGRGGSQYGPLLSQLWRWATAAYSCREALGNSITHTSELSWPMSDGVGVFLPIPTSGPLCMRAKCWFWQPELSLLTKMLAVGSRLVCTKIRGRKGMRTESTDSICDSVYRPTDVALPLLQLLNTVNFYDIILLITLLILMM